MPADPKRPIDASLAQTVVQPHTVHVGDSSDVPTRASAGSLDETVVRSSTPRAPMPDLDIPGYDLKGELSRGGQGVVYIAVQRSTGKRVAVKVMKQGPFAGAAARARFDREVRILAQLEHPSIVSIRDTGEATGCCYFVMDYISGKSLDAYAAGRRLNVRQTLELFGLICDAVNAAHLRGIIHRDLKPSNVHVDDHGQPHILDFGLAKVGDEADSSMTVAGEFLGSAPWASPEQVLSTSHTIDLRTDVYSTGVMLFQVLTGRFPYPIKGGMGMREILDHVVRTEPTRPRSLRREIDDEVETIVLKCLRKEPDRRYQSVGELARDLRHYLDGKPITAKGDSFGYMLAKTLRRHWIPAAATAAVAVVVVLALIVSIRFWQQSERRGRELAQANTSLELVAAEKKQEAAAAERARDAAEQAREQADAQRKAAEQQQRRAVRTTNFLLDMLRSADPNSRLGPHARVRDLLKMAADKLDRGELGAAPEDEAKVRNALGETYYALGMYEPAEAQFLSAIGVRNSMAAADPQSIAQSLNALGLAHLAHDRPVEAEAFFRAAMEMCLDLLGAQSQYAATARHNMALALAQLGRLGEAEEELRDALETRQLQGTNASTTDSLAKLGELYAEQERTDLAIKTLREAYRTAKARGFGDVMLGRIQTSLAEALITAGQLDEADALLAEALDLHETGRVAQPLHLAAALSARGRLRMAQSNLDEAEAYFEQALRIRRSYLAADHRLIGAVTLQLGRCLLLEGCYPEAERALLEAAANIIGRRGVSPRQTRLVAEALVELYDASDRPDEAAVWRARLVPDPG